MEFLKVKYKRHRLSLNDEVGLRKYFALYLVRVGECLEWQRASKGHGKYGESRGRMWIDGKLEYPYRVVASMKIGGKLPKGVEVQHLCNNSLCCEESHILIGSHKENMEHMAKCFRGNRGERHNIAKMKELDVKEARRLYSIGSESITDISKKFNVTPQTMWACLKGKTWKHLLPNNEY